MRTQSALLRKLRKQEKRLKVLTTEQRKVATRLQARQPEPPAQVAQATPTTPPSGGNPE